jgi:hypothetical protein
MRTPRLARTAAAALAVSTAMAVLPLARAQPGAAASSVADEAGARFRRGVELFKEADFRAALIEFRRAYQLAPNYRVLYNIGQAHLELQDYAGALRAFERYLNEGGAQVPAARRAAVEAEIQKLQSRVARIEIITSVAGAEIRVDDDVVGTSPLAQPVMVSAGRRKISAEKIGAPAATRTVDVAGGDRTTVALRIEAGAQAADVAPAPVSPRPSGAPSAAEPQGGARGRDEALPRDGGARSIPWIGWGATGALAAGAVVTGLLALRAKDDLTQKQNTFPGDPSALGDAKTKLRTFAVTSDILTGAAVVVGVTSLYFTLTSRRHGAPVEASLAPRVTVGIGHIQVDGRF